MTGGNDIVVIGNQFADGDDIDILTEPEARELTETIRLRLADIWPLVAKAYTRCAWLALGYSTWDDYCTNEFDSSHIRLPREEREAVVMALRDNAEMSFRAIATITGDSKDTVMRAYKAGWDAGVSNETPQLELVKGKDGKAHPAKRKSKKQAEEPLDVDTVPEDADEDTGARRRNAANKLLVELADGARKSVAAFDTEGDMATVFKLANAAADLKYAGEDLEQRLVWMLREAGESQQDIATIMGCSRGKVIGILKVNGTGDECGQR